ncbi:MAG: hypothetical protein M5U31_01045 [Acidimicrobiia bacterium]|nr:hypothetical protein [Acidimicrobiia bacterium]
MTESSEASPIADGSAADGDPGRPRGSAAFLVVLTVGCLLIAGAVVAGTLAVIAERELADEERAVVERDADASALRSELSDAHDLDSQIQVLVANQPALRAKVAESWNALVEQADAATRAVTRSIRASNDGDTEAATAILDTEVGAAVVASADHQKTLREAVDALAAAVVDLRNAIDGEEQS